MNKKFPTVSAFSRLNDETERPYWHQKEQEVFEYMKNELDDEQLSLFILELRNDVIKHFEAKMKELREHSVMIEDQSNLVEEAMTRLF